MFLFHSLAGLGIERETFQLSDGHQMAGQRVERRNARSAPVEMTLGEDNPSGEGFVYVPAPSPEEVARAATSRVGGWSAQQLAAWGVPWPPPKGWRKDLARKYRLGEDVQPTSFISSKEKRRREKELRMLGETERAQALVQIQDTGEATLESRSHGGDGWNN